MENIYRQSWIRSLKMRDVSVHHKLRRVESCILQKQVVRDGVLCNETG